MKEELLKLIKGNIDLDIVVMASTDDLIDEYGCFLLEKIRVEVADIYNSPSNEHIYFNKEDVVYNLREYLTDDERYANMPDEEYDKMCEEKAQEYFYKKAIVIWARN